MTVMKSPAICREETKFLGLLAKTQEKAAKLGNVSKRTFHNKNKTGTQSKLVAEKWKHGRIPEDAIILGQLFE